MWIKLSWYKYILAAVGLIGICVGISDGKLSVGHLVLGGLVASGILFLFGYGVERLVLAQKRPFAEVITSEAKPITPMKRKVSGIVVVAFGALIALFNQLGAGIFIAVVGIVILKPNVLDRVAERKPMK